MFCEIFMGVEQQAQTDNWNASKQATMNDTELNNKKMD